MPLQGAWRLFVRLPRALPWAMETLGFQPVFAHTSLVSRLCAHVIGFTSLRTRHWFHVYAHTSLVSRLCAHVIGFTSLRTRHWFHVFAHTSLVSHLCAYVIGFTFLRTRYWFHIFAHTLLVSHLCAYVIGFTSLRIRYCVNVIGFLSQLLIFPSLFHCPSLSLLLLAARPEGTTPPQPRATPWV